ncbi:MAG: Lrp/AsnC family transcriptional regulator [Rhodospirillaceae bacterium]|nr:Lrp/AsnC family transcriptional regulator [Rhodospirillales bacterium]
MDPIDRQLLQDFQRDLPLVARPYAAMAERLGIGETEVIDRLDRLTNSGAVSRVGAVLRPHTVGASTLAAMAVPTDRLDSVAALVSAYPEVNHNYQRDHRLNLWFVVATTSAEAVHGVLDDIHQRTGLTVLNLPLEQDFHIDLGFELSWT